MNPIARYFELDKHQTTIRREFLAGLTTFVTMAYIVVVNPKILEAAGIPLGASMVATILTAVIGTLLMGVYARRPFAIAPYMGENAFVAYTLVKGMGLAWQTVLGAIFISAVIFAILTLCKVRGWLMQSIPGPLKIGFTVGIGLFLAFIGLNEAGLVVLGIPGAPVKMGNLTRPESWMAILCFFLIMGMMTRNVPGAILLGMLITTALAIVTGLVPVPSQLISAPPDLTPTLWQLDIAGALQPEFFPIVLTLFVILFVDTMGTLIGVSYKAGFLDEQGHLPEVEKPMLCDSIATMSAAAMGTTAAGAYVESAAGVAAGGRSGLTAVVTAGLFLLTLFLAPILTLVPAYAYGPALIAVGVMMLAPIQRLNFEDMSELTPTFATIILICFTYNLGMGMAGGFITYIFMQCVAGRHRTIPPGLWALAGLSLLFFVYYPYG